MAIPLWLLFALLISAQAHPMERQDDDCHAPLGLSSFAVADEAITASSAHDAAATGPAAARLDREVGAGAWCPRGPTGPDAPHWLEVDLGRVARIVAVQTQGRHGQGLGREFVEWYFLDVWRPGMQGFERLPGGPLRGNVDTTTVAEATLDGVGVLAQRVRIVPFSRHPRTVCLRLELLGCFDDVEAGPSNNPTSVRRSSTVTTGHAQRQTPSSTSPPPPEDAQSGRWPSTGSLLTGAAAGACLTAVTGLAAAAIFAWRRRRATTSGHRGRLLASVGAPSPPISARVVKPPYLFGTSSTLASAVQPYSGLEAMLEPIYSEPKNSGAPPPSAVYAIPCWSLSSGTPPPLPPPLPPPPTASDSPSTVGYDFHAGSTSPPSSSLSHLVYLDGPATVVD